MKRKILIFINLILIGILLNSCEEFLKEEPKSFLSPQNAYLTSEDMLTALVGAYDALGSGSADYYKRRFMYMLFLASDEVITTNLANDRVLDNFTYNTTENNINSTWIKIYDAINRANVVIDRVDDVPEITAADANQIKAEAMFLRALHHFNLVRLYGPIPIQDGETTSLDDAFKERSPIVDVYNLIVSDLIFAKDNMDATNQTGRATSGAAKVLLAKVYLTRASSSAAEAADYQKCADLCNEVISSGNYSLQADFEKAIGKEDAYNSESIFEFECQRELSNGELSIWGVFTLPRDAFNGNIQFPQLGIEYQDQTSAPGNADLVSEVEFFNKFNPLDYRRDMTFVYSGVDTLGNPVPYENFAIPYPHFPYKYIDRSKPTSRSGYAFEGNVVILRLADVYLMKAEALNEVNNGPNDEAYAAINAIRERARNRDGLSNNGYPEDLSGLNYSDFKDAVLNERAIELAFEGHRWFDLVRTNRLVQLFNQLHPEYNVSEKHMLFPIPQNQIDLQGSKLIQNTGWE